MRLFGRGPEDHILAGLHTDKSVRAVNLLSIEDTATSSGESDEQFESNFNLTVAQRMGMSAADLYRDATEDILNGDIAAGLVATNGTEFEGEEFIDDEGPFTDKDSFREATLFYARATAVAKLADIRANEELSISGRIEIPKE